MVLASAVPQFIHCLIAGILEKPSIDPSYPELKTAKCKLFLVGKAGVGKTSTVARLSGRDVPPNHEETLGIHTTNIYWPVKVSIGPSTVMLSNLYVLIV